MPTREYKVKPATVDKTKSKADLKNANNPAATSTIPNKMWFKLD
jgi:hypothetical protein